MPRKPRVHFEGALYHVIVTGNNRSNIFEENENKQEYLDIIRRYKSKYGFKIYAYCIMDNHAHLLIQVDKIPLSKIMQVIQQVYTQRYNKAYKRTGHVFEQRYKGILCDKDNYLLSLIKYIHMNPVNAKMKNGLEYKWSSHNQYLRKTNNIVDCEFPLSLFSEDKKKRKKQYLEFITENKSYEIDDYALPQEDIKKYLDDKKGEKTLQIELEEIINKTLDYLDLPKEMIKSSRRSRKVSIARRLIILLAREYTGESNVAISKEIGVTKTLVSKVNNDLLDTDKEINKAYEELKNKINSTF